MFKIETFFGVSLIMRPMIYPKKNRVPTNRLPDFTNRGNRVLKKVNIDLFQS